MKLSVSVGLLQDLRFAISIALLPTLRTVLHSPLLLFRPHALSRKFMSHVWAQYGNGIDGNTQGIKESLIKPNVRGVVFDIGAGHSHTVKYLPADKVTKYVALEPNTLMHDEIRKLASEYGFTEDSGKLSIILYCAGDINLIISALGGEHSVDTLISILSLCSIPSAESVIQALVDHVLKPGGQFLFYEHVRHPREDIAWWQWFWTPVWKRAFDGCCLDRPTHLWIDAMPVWESKELDTQDEEPEEHLFPHRIGSG
ncbi:unnamed protein product [Somion occarium]|uniref:Methyltransferase type 11 domain-containing protein n=2 Tax=Somion occarium TaxID=3059160 RepID=A0ABP1D4E7_9APHY